MEKEILLNHKIFKSKQTKIQQSPTILQQRLLLNYNL